MEQSIYNWIAGVVIGGIGWFARMLWDRQEAQSRQIDSARAESARSVYEVREMIAGNYVSNTKLADVVGDLKEDLRYIRDKLDETPQRRAGDHRQ